MSYCINPNCERPQNSDEAIKCESCGNSLLLRSRYQPIEPLGKGGFGVTFLARDRSLPGNPICVIKELRPAASAPAVLEMARKLFEREAKTLGKIGDHPQIPRLLDYFELNQQFYLVQEYVKGMTIKDEVKQKGKYNEDQVKEFLKQILPVLQYIHDNQVIHRDIKPANIIRREIDNNLVLIDFGAVKDQVAQTAFIGEGGSDSTAFTKISIGTTGYAPSEQMGLRPVYASDIYALGVTCVFLLTGKSPNSIGSDPMTGEFLWKSHVYLSEYLESLLSRMMEPLVGKRYQSAKDVLRALNSTTPDADLNQSLTGVSPQRLGSVDEEKTKFETSFDTGFATGFNPHQTISPASQIAQEIKQRKERQAMGKTGLTIQQKDTRSSRPTAGRSGTGTGNSAASGGRLASSGNTTANSRTQNSRVNNTQVNSGKWTAEELCKAYFKGIRDFADCDLTGLNLSKAKLSNCNFYESRFTRSSLEGANLSEANFGRARLNNVSLKDANLSGANFANANLEEADLRGADLTGAYLMRCNLRGANLCGANLMGATVTDDQLNLAKTNWRTTKPDGKRGFGL